ncbi:MAG: hypothetical protein ACREP8_07645 [Candidatus Binatia bacterium]
MTSYNIIPDDVAQFILDHIDSIAQVEALLILRAHPDKDWDADRLARRLYISDQQTAEVLARLYRAGFLLASSGEPPIYRYGPTSNELKQLVDRLADVYSTHLVPVTNLIHSKPKSRVQEFADAFRLRKDK